MKRLIFICILALFSLSTGMSAQCSKKAQKSLDKAKEVQLTNQAKAITYLTDAIELCPESQEAVFLLADIYIQKKDHERVVEILNSYISKNPKVTPKAHFFIAQSQRAIFQFDEAAKNYNVYLNSDTKSKALRYKSTINLRHVLYSKEAYAQAPDIAFESMSSQINSNQSEYLPIMTADENLMVFTRRQGPVEQAFFSKRNNEGQWTTPNTLAGIPEQYRKAAISMSVDGQMLVLAMADDPRGLGNFDLYYMEMKDGKWTAPINFGPTVNTAGWESQPCISADGRTVYFSTDRKGGEGGNDIWKTKRQRDGSWSKPTNLGLDVNGPKNEESPFIHRDQRTLYFRSASHPGLGSYDIFMSRLIRFKKWTTPLNLGFPVNTVGNDGSLFVTLDGKTAYIASNIDHLNLQDYKNQIDLKHTDIYKFQLGEKFRPLATTYMKLKFTDAQTGENLQPALLLNNFQSNDTLFNGISSDDSYATLCLPIDANYALSAQLENYQPHFERFVLQSDNLPDDPLVKTIRLNKIPEVSTPEESNPIVLENVLFETNESTLQAGSYQELNSLIYFLNENKSVHIAIHGHTDNVGNDGDNLSLSTRRAQAVYDYLVQNNIEKGRLSFKGFGESKPIADNETEAGRTQNRRTEFVIVR